MRARVSNCDAPRFSAATSRYLYPMWSPREARVKHIPISYARLSLSRLFSWPSYLHKLSQLLQESCCFQLAAVRKIGPHAHIDPFRGVLCPGGTKAILSHSVLRISLFSLAMTSI